MPFIFSSLKWRTFLQISLSLLETGERNFRALFLFSKLEKIISNFSFSSRLDFLASRQWLKHMCLLHHRSPASPSPAVVCNVRFEVGKLHAVETSPILPSIEARCQTRMDFQLSIPPIPSSSHKLKSVNFQSFWVGGILPEWGWPFWEAEEQKCNKWDTG